MALTVQDDTGEVENANAYITLEYFKAYFEERAIDISDFDDEQINGAIVSATDYIDTRFNINGERLVEEQTTEFPRTEMYDKFGIEIEGIPTKLKKATAEYARQALINAGELAAANNSAQVLSFKEKVGPIEEETTYAAKTESFFKAYPMADALMKDFIYANRMTVFRA